MKTTKEIGDGGEDLAVHYLEGKGHQILERNFRVSFGEIDIITLDRDTLVFIEVKKKTTDRYGAPGEMITAGKLEKIQRTAEAYIAKHGLAEANCRIDAVLIDGKRVELLENISALS